MPDLLAARTAVFRFWLRRRLSTDNVEKKLTFLQSPDTPARNCAIPQEQKRGGGATHAGRMIRPKKKVKQQKATVIDLCASAPKYIVYCVHRADVRTRPRPSLAGKVGGVRRRRNPKRLHPFLPLSLPPFAGLLAERSGLENDSRSRYVGQIKTSPILLGRSPHT